MGVTSSATRILDQNPLYSVSRRNLSPRRIISSLEGFSSRNPDISGLLAEKPSKEDLSELEERLLREGLNYGFQSVMRVSVEVTPL